MINDHQLNEALEELQTLGDLMRWGMSRFHEANLHYGHGTDNAWDEALQLVLFATHLPLHDESMHGPLLLKARLTHSEKRQVLKLFQRRVNERIPAAYLTHSAWFAGLDFYIDERVLVPRSPLAELIEQGFTPWVKEDQVQHILDLCTGSACIAIACAMVFPEAKVDAVDISPDALAVAAMNVAHYDLQDRVRLLQSDLLSSVGNETYDVIISNPPYVAAHEYAALPLEYQKEPALGLVAGPQGLDSVILILQTAAKNLNPEGVLIVEVGNAEAALCEMYPEVPFTWLEFSRGGQGVFLLSKNQLELYFSMKSH
ncbi:50S ribosomal protein L3 N(5)-glutamine methyltransferase [soil metagenome]